MIRLHHAPGSRSFRTLWLLHEMGMSPEVVTYSIAKGEMQSEEYRQKSPGGRAPALEIDGLTMCESAAIAEYLCETRPEHNLAPAVGDPARARFLEAVQFAETQANLLANLNLQYLFLRDPAMRSEVVLKIETKRLSVTMAAMDKRLSAQDHLLEGGFSAADTMMGFNIDAAPRFVKLEPYPHLSAYFDRMKSRPAYQAALAVDGSNTFYKQDFYGHESG